MVHRKVELTVTRLFSDTHSRMILPGRALPKQCHAGILPTGLLPIHPALISS